MPYPYMDVLERYPGVEPLLEITDPIIDEAYRRVGELSTRVITRDMVAANLQTTLASPNTNTLMVPGTGNERMLGMLTLNWGQAIEATGKRNRTAWIDDVVVAKEARGQGISRLLMDAGEDIAALEASEVHLTSSTGRGPARAGYEKRGYVLQEQTLYRKDLSQIVMGEIVTSSHQASRLDKIQDGDILDLAALAGLPTAQVRDNVVRALVAPETTAVFVGRDGGDITEAAVANVYPIPVGRKPWIRVVGDNYSLENRALTAAEEWVAHRYNTVNIASLRVPPAAYKKRDSGLYIKQLPQVA